MTKTRPARDTILRTTLGLALALAAGCADTTPARISCKATPLLILSTSPLSLYCTVVNKSDKPIEGHKVSYATSAAGVAELSQEGSFRCLKSGDATLTLAAAGLSSSLAMKCRITTQISVPESLQLILGAPPVRVDARAQGQGGTALADVPVELTSSNPSVMTVAGDRASGLALGRATLKASVGPIASAIPVEVVDRIASEQLTLKDGAKRTWNLEPGDYRVEIDVQAPFGLAHGVTVSWDGATCEDQPEKQSHRLLCEVPAAASLTVTNPAQMGLGATLSGPINVYRVSRIPRP